MFLTNEQAIKLGQEVIDGLNLQVQSNGRVDTTWGDKSPEGLGRTIACLVEEALEATYKIIP